MTESHSPDTRIAEIRARLAAATDGPWRIEHTSQGYELVIVGKCLPGDEDDDLGIVARVPDMVEYANPEDAYFIANAPTDIAYLLDTYLPDQIRLAVEAERGKMDGLREACAEILGAVLPAWPAHGNVPLAIASALQLAVLSARGGDGL